METALKKAQNNIYSFVKCHGGWLGVSEFDQGLNDLNRVVIDEFYSLYPDCWVGVINRYDKNKPIMKKHGGDFVYNFQWVFIIPEFDQTLLSLIESYENTPYSSKLIKDIDKIFNRIEELKGITFQWV